MQKIEIEDAKTAVSAIVDRVQEGKPLLITRHGNPAAVLLSFEDWWRLTHAPSFGRLLMAAPLTDGDLAERDGTPLRDLDQIEARTAGG